MEFAAGFSIDDTTTRFLEIASGKNRPRDGQENEVFRIREIRVIRVRFQMLIIIREIRVIRGQVFCLGGNRSGKTRPPR